MREESKKTAGKDGDCFSPLWPDENISGIRNSRDTGTYRARVARSKWLTPLLAVVLVVFAR